MNVLFIITRSFMDAPNRLALDPYRAVHAPVLSVEDTVAAQVLALANKKEPENAKMDLAQARRITSLAFHHFSFTDPNSSVMAKTDEPILEEVD